MSHLKNLRSICDVFVGYGKLQSSRQKVHCNLILTFQNEEFIYLPPTEYDAEAIKALPDIHKDPFDRLLIAQAIENDLTIVTTDSKIPLYNVKTIW